MIRAGTAVPTAAVSLRLAAITPAASTWPWETAAFALSPMTLPEKLGKPWQHPRRMMSSAITDFCPELIAILQRCFFWRSRHEEICDIRTTLGFPRFLCTNGGGPRFLGASQ